jgi:hypothetical protein
MAAPPAATEAPIATAAVASESTSATAGSAAARQTGGVDSTANDSDGDGDGDAAGGAAGAPAKVPPQPSGIPVELVFGLGVALLALAIGSFFYTRSRR